MHENETKILRTTLIFDLGDGYYHIMGRATAYSPGIIEGFVTNYYVKVEGGKIVKVMNHQEFWREIPWDTKMDSGRINVPVLISCVWASDNSYFDIKLANLDATNLTIRGVEVWPEMAITSNATETVLTRGETVVFRVAGSFVPGAIYTVGIPHNTNGKEFTITYRITSPVNYTITPP